MNNCTTGTCGKALGVLRIITGIILLAFGLMKLGGGAAGMSELGAAAPALLPFLGFLSNVAWGWLATIGEILAGLMLISGCGILVRAGAIIGLAIMVFAWNAQGIMPPLVIVVLGSLAVLFMGPGKWKFCGAGCPCNKGGACAGGACSTGVTCGCGCKDGSCGCKGGSCETGSKEKTQEEIQQK